MTAYLLEPPTRFNLSSLYEKHRVGFIFDDKEESFALKDEPEKLFARIAEWSEFDFDPQRDLLVLTGNLTMLVVAALAIQRTHKKHPIRLLRYDHPRNTYEEIRYGEIYGSC